MVLIVEVEPAALHHQDLLLQQQVLDEELVVVDLVDLGIEAGERVERALGLDATDAGDLVELLPRHVALLVEASTGRDERLDALVTAERHLNRVLAGDVRAQARRRQDAQALDEALGVVLGAGEHDPACPIATDAVRLREPVERQAEQVGGKRRDVDVLSVVVEDLVVDLVGEDEQRVASGNVDELLEHLARVDGSRGVVGIDDDDRLGAVGDLRLDVGDVGVPVVVLVAAIVHGRAAGEGRHGRPEGIVGRGDQHLVAVVEQRLHRHGDELGDTVPEDHVVDVEVREVGEELVAGDHRASRREHAGRLRIPLRVRQRVDHVAHDHVWRLEAE